MSIYILVLLFFTSMLGGAINAVAGGGSFFTFPTLIFAGVPIIKANATSTVALWPGSIASTVAYKKQLSIEKDVLIKFGLVSITGSIIGTWLLLCTPSDTLKLLLPYLLLVSTLILFFKNKIAKSKLSKGISSRFYLVLLLQFIIAIYGGYFGGGIGILMLATFNLMGFSNMVQMNALKTLLATMINGAAVIVFTVTSQVVWHIAIVMLIGGSIGGYFGAHIGKSISPVILNRFVVITGFLLTVWFFFKAYQ